MNGQQQVMGGAIMMSHPEPDMDDTMRCQMCGHEFDGDENYCPECGARVSKNDDGDHDDMANSNAGENVNREGTVLRNNSKTAAVESVESANAIPNLLVETEQGHVQILEGYSDGYLRAKMPVTTVDVSNRNGRTYSKELVMKEVSGRFEGRVLGQSKHPQSDPDLLDQFIIWEKAMLENDGIEYFIAKIVPTQRGKDFAELARAGAMIATSRRGTGELKEGVDKFGTKTKIVSPNGYTLMGIDLIYPGMQSDRNAQQNTIHFESIQSTESVKTEMPESNELAEQETVEPIVSETVETPVEETSTSSAPAPDAQDTQAKPNTTTAANTASITVTALTQQDAPIPADVIESLTSQIQAKDALISTQNVKLSELAGKNATQAEQVKAMTESFTALNNEILRLEKTVSELNAATQERTQMVRERDELLVKRNKTLADRQRLLVQAHETVAERDVALAEKNQMVMQRNMLVSQRDSEIAKLHKELEARNATLQSQDRTIQERDAAIAEKDTIIAQERASLAERDAMIAQIDLGLVERDNEILTLQTQLLAEKVNIEVEKERNKAFQYLFEKVQIEGEKASWFIFNDLRNCATVQEVDEKFEASKTKGIQLIEGVARTAGKAVLKDTVPTDADEPLPTHQNGKPADKKGQDKDANAEQPELLKRANKVARLGGI